MYDKDLPIVSVLVPNYNYAQYLPYCLDSVLNQTYNHGNIELIIQDNASTDESYDIILDYERKYLHGETDVYVRAERNKRNVGSDSNSTICENKSEGKYILFLSSDDALKPDYIERCVEVLEKNQTVSMVMVHREEIDEKGNLCETPPFYNESFIVDGESQAAVFMMAGVAVPTQVLIRAEARKLTLRYRFYQMQVAGDWYSNFLLSCVGDIAYIKDPLCEYRVHTGNETDESEKKLLGIFEHFVIINAFSATANSIGYQKPQKRYQDAIEKLGDMCLRYALKMLQNRETECAKRYLHLSLVFKEKIQEDVRYKKLWEIVNAEDREEFENGLKRFAAQYVLTRTVSYDPPEGYVRLSEKGEKDV